MVCWDGGGGGREDGYGHREGPEGRQLRSPLVLESKSSKFEYNGDKLSVGPGVTIYNLIDAVVLKLGNFPIVVIRGAS